MQTSGAPPGNLRCGQSFPASLSAHRCPERGSASRPELHRSPRCQARRCPRCIPAPRRACSCLPARCARWCQKQMSVPERGVRQRRCRTSAPARRPDVPPRIWIGVEIVPRGTARPRLVTPGARSGVSLTPVIDGRPGALRPNCDHVEAGTRSGPTAYSRTFTRDANDRDGRIVQPQFGLPGCARNRGPGDCRSRAGPNRCSPGPATRRPTPATSGYSESSTSPSRDGPTGRNDVSGRPIAGRRPTSSRTIRRTTIGHRSTGRQPTPTDGYQTWPYSLLVVPAARAIEGAAVIRSSRSGCTASTMRRNARCADLPTSDRIHRSPRR